MENIRIVMIGTTHPGNIGAAARAMKTMGLRQLDLVAPRYFPHPDAVAMASGADDLLASARVFATLEEAIADCALVIGLSARPRRLACENLDVRTAVERAVQTGSHAPVAFLFGREHSGLSNEELNRCHYLVHIPTDPDFSSLNVAAAVQVMAYEVRQAIEKGALFQEMKESSALSVSQPEGVASVGQSAEPPAGQEEVDLLIHHLERVVLKTGFLNPDNPRKLMYRLRRFFQRAQPDQNEVNIWRGILASVENPLPSAKQLNKES
jgi:TrmH family RNA methyltransferase